MSDLKPEPISGEIGTIGAGPAAPDMPAASAPVTAASEVESPRLAPEQEETSPKADTPKVQASKVEAPKAEAPKVEATKPEPPRVPGKVMIMSPGDRVGASAKPEAASGEASPATTLRRSATLSGSGKSRPQLTPRR